MIKHSQYPRGKAPSHMLMALLTGASAVSPAFAADAVVAPVPATSTPGKAEPTVAPVVVKGERDTDKPASETSYRTDTTRIGKMDAAPKDIPQSITIVTDKFISDRKNDSLSGALTHVAGLSFNAGEGGRIGDNLNLRGYVSYGDIYLDGIRDIAQYNREVFNLERVEVLRGSASMLFGRGSTGGVINQVSKQPYLADENQVDFTVGDNAYYRTAVDLNKAIGETSAFRLNAMYTKADGTPSGADSKRYGIAPTFRTGIGTPDEFTVGYYHLNYDNTPNFGYAWVGGRPLDIAADKFYGLKSDYQRDSADVFSGDYVHRFDNKTQLRSALRYGEYKRSLWATQTASLSSPVTETTAVRRSNPNPRGGEDHTVTSQTDLTSRFEAFGMKHEALAGLDLSHEASDSWGIVGLPAKPNTVVGTPNANDPIPAYTATNSNFTSFGASSEGVYAQDTIEFVPHWKLLAGARWDRFAGDYKRGADSTAVRFQRKDYLWSYRTGLMYQPTDAQTYYVSHGNSYGTSGDLYQYDASTANTPPEQAVNTEIGAKYEMFEGDLSLRAALFRSKKYNERSTDVATVPGAGNLLSGERHTDGWEIEATGLITKKLEVFFNFAHMWSNVDAAGNAPAAQLTVGGPTANTPTNSGALWMLYTFVPDWQAGFGADGQTKRNFSHGSSNNAPGFVKYDAMLKYEQPRYELQLNINNLFNKIYWQSVYNGFVVAGPVRTVQLTTTLKF
ncbi:MAG TPA: TonB-dependent siderophore receptor [Rhodocyclaceae bacterium]|nr:TonB-dependent siderophore receptor [Rhodocyclaceae bacterium]